MARRASNVVIAAFTEEEAQRLTKISLGQLKHWNRTSFFVPSLKIELENEGDTSNNEEQEIEPRQAYYYSFRDLVSLQVLNQLRNEAKVSLQHLRKVKDKLASLGNDNWCRYNLYVLNRKVHFRNPDTDQIEEVLSGQGVLQIPLEIVRANMENAVRSMRSRDASNFGKIDRRRGVARNKPVVAGTGIQVASIKAYIAAGYTVKEILKEYPSLTEEDVEAAISFDTAAA